LRACQPRSRPAGRSDRRMSVGFSMLELVVVLVVVGALAAVALPRMLKLGDLDEPAFADEVASTLRYARKLATATRRVVCVSVASDGITLTMDHRAPESYLSLSCAASPMVEIPGSHCAANKVCTPSGVALSATPASFRFSGSGESNTDVTVTVGSKTLSINRFTGYIR